MEWLVQAVYDSYVSSEEVLQGCGEVEAYDSQLCVGPMETVQHGETEIIRDYR